MREFMPIMGGDMLKAIPWSVIEPHERQADANHGQSLERLAQRGGLSPSEALTIIKGQPWPSGATRESEREAEKDLMLLLQAESD